MAEKNNTQAGNVGTGSSSAGLKEVVAAPKPKTVEVPETVLKDILYKMENYQREISDLKTAQKEYESSASQDQILKIEKMRASGKLIKSVRVAFHDNKMVVGWQPTSDDAYVEVGTGKVIEVQRTKITYLDGKELELPQLDFARRKMMREYEVIKEGRNQNGNILYTLMTEGGKEVEIDGTFVNS